MCVQGSYVVAVGLCGAGREGEKRGLQSDRGKSRSKDLTPYIVDRYLCDVCRGFYVVVGLCGAGRARKTGRADRATGRRRKGRKIERGRRFGGGEGDMQRVFFFKDRRRVAREKERERVIERVGDISGRYV